MNSILKELEGSSKFSFILKDIENKKSPIGISGLVSVAETELISSVSENLKKPILLVTYNAIEAQKIVNDLKFFTNNVLYLPPKEIVTYDYMAESKDVLYDRIDILNKIYKNQNIIIVTTIEAVKQKIISKNILYKNVLKFKVGDKCDLEELKQKLVDLGYERFELIDGRGEFSIRGDIIDVSINNSEGIRIELWGDEIDSIRCFNIVSQRSKENLNKIEIFPAYEFVLEKPIQEVITNIKENQNKQIENIKDQKYYESIKNKVEEDIEQIENGNYLSKIEKYFNSFYNIQETIFDYLSDKYIVFIDDLNKCITRSKNIEQDVKLTIESLILKEKKVPEGLLNYIKTDDIISDINKHQTIFLDKLDNLYKSNIERYEFDCRELNYFKTSLDLFINDIINFRKQKLPIFIISETKEKAKKIEKILEENEIPSIYEESINQVIINKNDIKTIILTTGKLSGGYISSDLNTIIIVRR